MPLAHRGNPLVTLRFPAGSVSFRCPDGVYAAGDYSSPGIAAELMDDVVITRDETKADSACGCQAGTVRIASRRCWPRVRKANGSAKTCCS